MDHVSFSPELNWPKWTRLPTVVPSRHASGFAASDILVDDLYLRLCGDLWVFLSFNVKLQLRHLLFLFIYEMPLSVSNCNCVFD